MSRKDSQEWLEYLKREQRKDDIALLIIILILFLLPFFI